MRRRDQRLQLIRAIEREYEVIALAVDTLNQRLAADSSWLTDQGLARKDLAQAIRNLQATYMVRLFAEFETGLREAWRRAYRKRSHPRTRELLIAFAARCSISEAWYQAVDEVRQYRNALVHEEDERGDPIAVAVAGRSLCRFFSRLPSHW